MMVGIYRHAGRFLAWSNWPVRDHLVGPGVYHSHFALVFKVAINAAGLFVLGSELGLAFQRNRRSDVASLRVEYRGRAAAAIEGINLLVAGFEQNGVRILTRVHF